MAYLFRKLDLGCGFWSFVAKRWRFRHYLKSYDRHLSFSAYTIPSRTQCASGIFNMKSQIYVNATTIKDLRKLT